jgi:hypothetical protein
MSSTLELPVARFLHTFNRLRQDAIMRMGQKKEALPEQITLPGQAK